MLISIICISISCIIIWRSSHGFEIASDFLGRKMPLGIKGATINAIASSMPEFLTTLFFLFYLRDADGFSGGLGVTSGSALFNLLIIPALVVLMLFKCERGRCVELNKKVLLREGSVLLISQLIFVSFLFSGKLLAKHGLVMVLVYLIYLVILFLITRKRKKSKREYVRPVAAPKRKILGALLTLDMIAVVLSGRKITTVRAWVLLGFSTLVMSFGTWLLVYGTDLFGELTNIPLIFVAVVFSAAATSVPDTIISIKDARKGNYDDAVSNALGSNIFDIAFALGFPILLYNLIHGESVALDQNLLAFTKEVWVFLLLATFLALAIMLTGKKFTRPKALMLLGIYLLFLFFVGTQVREGFGGIGEPIGEFLKSVADWIGTLLN
ncbi:MAG: sodium:calcium antiporter [Bacteroidetes bacterium]|nr:MAG: sodium:calcium antiporter [Bacteroidota bacterium]